MNDEQVRADDMIAVWSHGPSAMEITSIRQPICRVGLLVSFLSSCEIDGIISLCYISYGQS